MNPALDKFTSAELRLELLEREWEARRTLATLAWRMAKAAVAKNEPEVAKCRREIVRLANPCEWRER